ncbi:hypothetical protein HYPSUDRAFT_143058, partial [Hypholoma sublateritium FD-334 SS-4]
SGTGGISNLFVAFPYGNGSTPMLVISLVIFFINLSLFILFFVLVAAKYICYPDRWAHLIQNPIVSLYAGTFPMGATTLINIAVSVIHEKYQIGGKAFLYFLWAAWWLDVLIACLCTWVGVHVMFIHQKHSLETMTAMWLLPVVTLIVAASTGGILANSLEKYSPKIALDTLTVSTFLVTVGFTLAFMILTIYLLRLILHGLPAGGTVLSVFLPLGPTGQAGYAILLIGQGLSTLFPAISTASTSTSSEAAGAIINIVCTSIAFVLWSLATMWIIYAVLAIQSTLRKSIITFRISFWGLVFPNAVYANLTISLSKTFDSGAFRIWGAIYAVFCLLLWICICCRSLLELKSFYSIQEDDKENSTPTTNEYK